MVRSRSMGTLMMRMTGYSKRRKMRSLSHCLVSVDPGARPRRTASSLSRVVQEVPKGSVEVPNLPRNLAEARMNSLRMAKRMSRSSVMETTPKSRVTARMMRTPMRMRRELNKLPAMKPCSSTTCQMMNSTSGGC